MLRRIGSFASCAIALVAFAANTYAQSTLTAKATSLPPAASSAEPESDRLRDGMVGPVRRVRTEVAKLSPESGKMLEGKHAVLEVVSYDLKGTKVENQYFPIAGANLTGKEVYKYDDKGNLSEMTLLNTDGSLVSKEVYKYEFDFAGNWNKMTTSVAVIEGGKLSFEPTEVTYRSIMYYLDENMLKMSQPAAQPASSPAVPANSVAVGSLDNKGVTASPKPVVNSAGNSSVAKNNPVPAQKNSPSLPNAMTSTDKVTGLASVEPGNNATSSSTLRIPVVQMDSEPPPAPAPRPILKPVSGGVLNGTAISLPSPVYPDTARRFRVSGLVTVEVVVDEKGQVISAVATSGPPSLREVAVQAALRARFSPTKLSGQPVKVAGTINYKFSLAQ
jgi:TonB family protein